MEIAEIKVARQGDVTVVPPIEGSVNRGRRVCAAMLTPFEAKVELGKFETKTLPSPYPGYERSSGQPRLYRPVKSQRDH